MKKNLAVVALSSLMICSLSTSALAAENLSSGVPAPMVETEDLQILADSQLYYGEVKEIITGEGGIVTGLHMDSAKSGELVLNLSDETVWIDSGKQSASDPSTLKVGERLYVFHSPNTTRSLPPQSAAFAIVRNIPQDTGCAQYHEVEAVEEKDGTFQITTDDGSLFLFADEKTKLSAYVGDAPKEIDSIKVGSHVMAWYKAEALSSPGQAYANHIMTLEQGNDSEPLTRSAFAVLLHTAQGSPVVNYVMDYSDVDPAAPYAEAIRWAASKGLMSGYGDGRVGPEDTLNREQLAVILWRQSGSPMLMDYPGLTKYSDAGDISRFTQPALAWVHQKGLLPDGDRLNPKDTVTQAEAEKMLLALGEQN